MRLMGIVGGLAAGFVYANGFEYCLHRFLLHSGRGIFSQQHMIHHNTLNSPEAPRFVNFSSNPGGVVALFFANAIPFLVLQWVLIGSWHDAWAAGVFASFAIYYIAFEEIHWRTHMGGWLPNWLRGSARHHLLHHAHDTDRFKVFLPLFDRLTCALESVNRTGFIKPDHCLTITQVTKGETYCPLETAKTISFSLLSNSFVFQ